MQTLAELFSHPLLDRAVYSQYAPPYLRDIAPSGAVSGNAEFEAGRADKWWIEIQRPGADLIQAGVVREDAEMITAGWNMLGWGLQRQDGEGGFGDTSGGVLSVAFFVEAVARALLVHQCLQRPAENADALVSRLRRAATHLRAEVDRTATKTLDACAHRWWLLAAAFAETDAVLGDGEFLAIARRCAEAARRRMTREGIIKEGGGFDVRYQALGLLYAARYALLDGQGAKQPDGNVLQRLLGKALGRPPDCVEAVHRAAGWLVSRQGVAGLLNPAGSSRYLGARDRNGTLKQIDYYRALEALVLCAGLTGDDRLLGAAKAMEPYAVRDVNRLRDAAPGAGPALAFVFVCRSGEREIEGLLLAASLRRHCGANVELIAAVPAPSSVWGDLSEGARATLDRLDVQQAPIENPISADSGAANKIASLAVPTRTSTLVLLDSDVLCLAAPDPRALAQTPLCAKVADLRMFPEGNAEWAGAFEAAQMAKPSRLVKTSVDDLPSPPVYDAAVIAIEARFAATLGEVWANFSKILRERRGPSKTSQSSDDLAFAVALEKLKLIPIELDTRLNQPVQLVPLADESPPVFARYQKVSVLAREPLLRETVRSLCEEYPRLKQLAEAHEGWKQLAVSAPAVRRGATANTVLLTGISRSGTSFLCNLIHRYSNCVALNETPELVGGLKKGRVAWPVSAYLRDVRASVLAGEPIRNKLQNGSVTQDTAKHEELGYYHPRIDDADFVLAAKNTFAFISSLDRLRLAMPQARIVICVRNPWDTLASWKTSFEHLYKADLSIRPVGNPRDPWLAPASQRQLAEIEAITDLPVRRARLWAYLAERVLADRNHILVRYEDLATDPLGQLARILEGLPVGTLREPIEPGKKSSRREALDASDHDAIATLCKSAGEALGVYEL